MYKQLLKKIIQNGKSEDMEHLEFLLDDFIHDLKVEDYSKYKELEFDLYKRVYGEHLNEELAKKWVSEMKNKDGSTGGHWSVEQTTQYAGNHNKWDWFAIMNMMFSDFGSSRFDTTTYVELANDWIKDKDVPEGKTLRYYLFVVNCE